MGLWGSGVSWAGGELNWHTHMSRCRMRSMTSPAPHAVLADCRLLGQAIAYSSIVYWSASMAGHLCCGCVLC